MAPLKFIWIVFCADMPASMYPHPDATLTLNVASECISVQEIVLMFLGFHVHEISSCDMLYSVAVQLRGRKYIIGLGMNRRVSWSAMVRASYRMARVKFW